MTIQWACMRARWAAEMLQSMELVKKNADRIKCPILLLHGGDDDVANLSDRGTRATKDAEAFDLLCAGVVCHVEI